MKSLNSESRLYNVKKPIIGITGGIASGKSTFCKILEDKGYKIIDADRLVKEIYKLKESKKFIEKYFSDCISKDEINFKRLREVFFLNKKNQTLIEGFIYSKLPSLFLKEIQKITEDYIFYDVPLLFERGLEEYIDLTICVYTPRGTQIKRLMKRDQIDQKLAQNIIDKQIDIELKKEKSDILIRNVGPNQALREQSDMAIKKINEYLINK